MDIESARQFSGRRLRVWPADIDATGGWTRRYLPGGWASGASLLWRLDDWRIYQRRILERWRST